MRGANCREINRGFKSRKISRSRIKRLRGLARPQYRLRVGDVRVVYDVTDATVEILAIVAKPKAQSWLARHGNPG
jgi:mRNA interferase RelE/StbE